MRRGAVIACLLTAAVSTHAAEDASLEGREAVTTAKERLVNKAADPQRVDDCNVPAEKRDPDTVRQSDCPHLKEDSGTDSEGSED